MVLRMQELKFVHRGRNAIGVDGGREAVGWRKESDWAADGIPSGGGREQWKDVGDYETESEK